MQRIRSPLKFDICVRYIYTRVQIPSPKVRFLPSPSLSLSLLSSLLFSPSMWFVHSDSLCVQKPRDSPLLRFTAPNSKICLHNLWEFMSSVNFTEKITWFSWQVYTLLFNTQLFIYIRMRMFLNSVFMNLSVCCCIHCSDLWFPDAYVISATSIFWAFLCEILGFNLFIQYPFSEIRGKSVIWRVFCAHILSFVRFIASFLLSLLSSAITGICLLKLGRKIGSLVSKKAEFGSFSSRVLFRPGRNYTFLGFGIVELFVSVFSGLRFFLDG